MLFWVILGKFFLDVHTARSEYASQLGGLYRNDLNLVRCIYRGKADICGPKQKHI